MRGCSRTRGIRRLPERNELIARIGSIITISAPFRGTPLARRVGRGAWLAAPALWFGSILASRHRLRLAGQVATLFNLLKRAALGRSRRPPTRSSPSSPTWTRRPRTRSAASSATWQAITG